MKENIPTVKVSDSPPVIYNIVSYYDNTLVVHIIRTDLLSPKEVGKLWLDKYLSIRTVYPNGSVIPLDIQLDIQDFNFCILYINGIQASPIRIYPIRSNFLIVTYSETTNLTDPFSYTDWAMIVDLNGNIYSKISFGSSYVDVATNQWLPGKAVIFLNSNPDNGFLRMTPMTNTTNASCEQYEVHINTVIPMVDEYGHATKRDPTVFYQTPISGLSFTDIDCDVSYVGIGQCCIVTGVFIIRAVIKKFYLKIDFLSNGTVIKVLPLMSDLQTNPLIEQYNIEALPYGGYLLSGIGTDDSGISAQVGEKLNWTLFTIELKKFEIERDHGYSNFHIDSTYPHINEIIELNTESLAIKYFNAVELSDGHIKIFHENGKLRQTILRINNAFVTQSVDGDSTTVIVKLLESTLNLPGSKYYVTIDNNFVKSRVYQEPLYGVKEHVWSFTTPKEEDFSGSVSGQIRLTAEGTVHFESLNENDRKMFFANLIRELADAIPVSYDRVTTNERNETDASTPQKQFLLPINILNDKTRKEIAVNLASRDLDLLIRNKHITAIGSGEYSKYLDDSYGYKLPKRKNADAKNTAIFQLVIVIFDIIMDIAFCIKVAKRVEKLFIPREKHKVFLEWSRENKYVVDLFTVLAGSEVEVLTVLESNIWNFDFFNAKFSKEGLSGMFLGSCFNVIFEDIPQLFIQIGRCYSFRDHGKTICGITDNVKKSNAQSNEMYDENSVENSDENVSFIE
ncbi:5792_t:CDS:10 [Funneliformis mosseae]|uniref:5792_t:CDS:1 n=1 Tax=Funneliformis mosseae TaxID=27381 RepID=A0A9N8ZDD7_FUNMO|nr:5792_t:CDS:10 [Funneliformis mosseae]